MDQVVLDNEPSPESDIVHRWVAEIKLYEREASKWEMRSKRILRRYRDQRNDREENLSRYNIFWSNIQTLTPMLYGKEPKPDISRRFKDEDPVGRVASDIMERASSYFVNDSIFGNTMRQVVFDRLVPGRGTAWVRYVPHFKDMAIQGSEEIKDDGFEVTDDAESEPTPQEVYFEEVICDYVHWQDFGHTWGRTWEEVGAVWRKAYMTRDELVKRFGEVGNIIPLDYAPKDLKDTKIGEQTKKATIYEIWDKKQKKAIWLHIDYLNKPLDVQDDPLKLKNFFPCPKPIYATLANDSLIPTPDYQEYQDQLIELDNLTARINAITKAVKVAGVYDSSAEGVQRLLAEGTENQLIPVENWAIFGDKGGLKGAMELMPMQEIAQTLLALYEARSQVKTDLYEISGLSDIIRGATDPDETAAAQELKGQYASMRLGEMQREVHRFARDLVASIAEIVANHFGVETLKAISGVKLMTTAEKQQVQAQLQQQQTMAQQAQASGQQVPPPPPLPEEVQRMLDDPSWEEVDALFKDDCALHFRIDIETDSTIKADQEADKASRIEFLTAVGQFLKQATQVSDPTLAPLLAQMMMFGVRGFHVGKELEGIFQSTLKKLEKKSEEAEANPKPDPEMQKAQIEAQSRQQEIQANAQAEQMKLQSQEKLAQMQMQLDMQEARNLNALEAQRTTIEQQNQLALEQAKMQHELVLEQMRGEMQAQTEIILQHIRNEGAVETAQIAAKANDGAESSSYERSKT